MFFSDLKCIQHSFLRNPPAAAQVVSVLFGLLDLSAVSFLRPLPQVCPSDDRTVGALGGAATANRAESPLLLFCADAPAGALPEAFLDLLALSLTVIALFWRTESGPSLMGWLPFFGEL